MTISNDESAAVQAWKLLVASGVPNVYVLEGGINRWIAFFGKEDSLLQPVASAADDELGYVFKAALAAVIPRARLTPSKNEHLEFDPRIVLQPSAISRGRLW